MLEHFPPGVIPREEQKEALKEIESAASSGYRNIILCAPTGVGKSHIAMTFLRRNRGGAIVTRQKILQKQYSDEFGYLSMAMGRGNYRCIDYDGTRAEGTSCMSGKCTWHENGKKHTCDMKPIPDDFVVLPGGNIIPPDNSCLYYSAKYTAMLSKFSIYNYASFFHFNRYGKMTKKSLVLDEAHEIEESLVEHLSHVIDRQQMDEAGVSTAFKADIDSVRQILFAIYSDYSRRARTTPTHYRINHYSFIAEKCKILLDEISKHPDNIIAGMTAGSRTMKVSFIDVSSAARRVFNSPCQLFMSATISVEPFCQTMGFDRRDCKFIEILDSPFPAENRRINMMNVTRINKNTMPEELDRAVNAINKLMDMHKNQKGIILATSIAHCKKITESVHDSQRIIPVYSMEGQRREKQIEKHAESEEPTVLLSPSLWSGIDLKGKLSEFQIIFKVPYASTADPRVRKLSNSNQVWYRYNAMMKFLQGCGRSIRVADDSAPTYVIDAGLPDLIKTTKRYIPRSYADAFCTME